MCWRVLGFIVLLYIPDTKAVLARMFFGDHFHHFDSFLAPAWAYTKGAVLNVDIMTEYGIGIPVMMSWFAKLTGGFSYTHMFWFWMWGTIVYFILCFVFLRRWLGSFALALVGDPACHQISNVPFRGRPICFYLPKRNGDTLFLGHCFLFIVIGASAHFTQALFIHGGHLLRGADLLHDHLRLLPDDRFYWRI